MIILDTNVLSELLVPSPSQIVINWLAGRNPASVFTTSVTEAEILYGLRLLRKVAGVAIWRPQYC